jgi:ankyrin repeat protein
MENEPMPMHVLELHEAAQKGQLEAVRRLVGGSPALIDALDPFRRSPIATATIGGHLRVVQLLVGRGAALDTRDRFGRTPLFYACRENRAPILEYLLSKGADPNHRTSYGETGLRCV